MPSAEITEPGAAAAPLDILLIRLDRELYALPSSSVREVLRYRDYTPVPGAPPALPGVLNQRGAIVPIVVPYILLGLTAPPITRATRLVLIQHNEIDLALLVEQVLDLAAIPASALEPPPSTLDPSRARLLRGVASFDDQLLGLLDLDELLHGLRSWE